MSKKMRGSCPIAGVRCVQSFVTDASKKMSIGCQNRVPRAVSSFVSDEITKIDRMDSRSLFTSHYTRDGRRTLCGLSLLNCYTQPWCDNGFCRRCEKIAMRCQNRTPRASFDQKETGTMIKHAASHFDHGLTEAQVTFMMNTFGEKSAFFIATIELPEALGTVPCGLHGPIVGDAPVEEAAVTYAKRGTRAWDSRLVDRPTKPSRQVTVIAGPHEETCSHCNGTGGIGEWKARIPCSCDGGNTKWPCIVYTMFGGPLAPQEPGDPGCKDVEASKQFWAQHALSR